MKKFIFGILVIIIMMIANINVFAQRDQRYRERVRPMPRPIVTFGIGTGYGGYGGYYAPVYQMVPYNVCIGYDKWRQPIYRVHYRRVLLR